MFSLHWANCIPRSGFAFSSAVCLCRSDSAPLRVGQEERSRFTRDLYISYEGFLGSSCCFENRLSFRPFVKRLRNTRLFQKPGTCCLLELGLLKGFQIVLKESLGLVEVCLCCFLFLKLLMAL